MVEQVVPVFLQAYRAGAGCHRGSNKAEPRSVAGLGIALLLIAFKRGAMFEVKHRVRRRRVPIEANRVVRVG